MAATFGLSIRLQVVGLSGKFLNRDELTKRRKEFAHKLGLIVGQQEVQYAK